MKILVYNEACSDAFGWLMTELQKKTQNIKIDTITDFLSISPDTKNTIIFYVSDTFCSLELKAKIEGKVLKAYNINVVTCNISPERVVELCNLGISDLLTISNIEKLHSILEAFSQKNKTDPPILYESSDIYNNLQNTSLGYILFKDYICIEINRHAIRLFSCHTDKEFSQWFSEWIKTALFFSKESSSELIFADMINLAYSGNENRFETSVSIKNVGVRWLEITICFLSKNPLTYFFLIYDVTDFHAYFTSIEEKIVESEARVNQRTKTIVRTNFLLQKEIKVRKSAESKLNRLIDLNPEALILLRLDGSILRINSEFETMLGYKFREISDEKIFSIIKHQESKEILYSIFEDVNKNAKLKQQKYDLDLVFLSKENAELSASISLNTIPIEDEETIVAMTVKDITFRKKYEAALKESLQKEKALHELKSRFISIVSHEFRTPMTAIYTASLLIKKNLTNWHKEKTLDYLNDITISIDRLTNMLEDITFLNRTDTNNIKLLSKKTNLKQLCLKIIEHAKLNYPDSQVNVAYLLSSDIVEIDDILIYHILINLISNAMKYSLQKTPVSFTVRPGQGVMVFEVKDNGIGIPEKDRELLFTPFYRAGNVGTIKGTGLGLLIAKRSVELHGGSIRLQSTEGVGSLFIVEIPNEDDIK